ncbi:prephenate dehydratase [Phaeovibrio sulfidiphilus]|uniref:prephenate dehydratase n=1 Tax=Phaeovibrio sulfidiphilus TaxID=1220600 RepID=A0A8J6YX60_9PROT|nr:prephenate dehydratase [Phaeovibrio sulfidiphilus]MBE1237317.1 prephenate dehydratase [Phaeovibrio sulfidiphilus]
MTTKNDPLQTVAFQGLPGAYSHMACTQLFPNMAVLPCPAFEDVFAAVREGRARYAMMPIENSVAGRVADVHHLMPGTGLHIVQEYFLKVSHHLLVNPGTRLEDVRIVRSHIHALGQCRKFIKARGLNAVVHADTAGAACELAENKRTNEAAIASALAADIYGLESLQGNIEDETHNTTRFLIMAREPVEPRSDLAAVTSFVFRVRNVPAALYKALGGFATNGINITKLESYQVDGSFVATRFYADVEGRPSDPQMCHAFEELRHFTHELHILGVYPAHPYRFEARIKERLASPDGETA